MKALITGITGQDGSYLAELLLKKGYEVHGIVRRSSIFNTDRINHLHNIEEDEDSQIFLHYGDLSDSSSLFNVINKVKPDEIYNLGAMSHVKISFETPEYTGDVTGLGVTRLLENIKNVNPKIKFYQASSSEMFGNSPAPQNEDTLMIPASPYACAKLYAYNSVRLYREAYGLFAVNGILFNHESPRRGENFVTRKIVKTLIAIKNKQTNCLYLGNLDAKRDWGFAKDYVEAMWLMLQQERPDDYVIATGETHTVRDFVEETCKLIGFDLKWQGKGLDEVGIADGKQIIRINQRFFRPSDVNILKGDATKAYKELGWKPKFKFKELVKIMVENENNG